ncbi:hypothetical protein [Sphingopyxis sp. HIX]|uniref:hypothetical protein n=1 Tax=Sphingopyxis sp. HIX TaxID=1759074 RepID=UPI0012E34294|nr:hypothetical protein [Sphingopyxis sp. HIX]
MAARTSMWPMWISTTGGAAAAAGGETAGWSGIAGARGAARLVSGAKTVEAAAPAG